MNPFALPVRRPVATAMFFTAVVLMGVVACQTIPVDASTIRTKGWPGRRIHARTHTAMMISIMPSVPHCIS